MEQSRKIKMIETITNLSDERLKEVYERVLDELLSFPYEEDLKVSQKFMEFEIVRRWTRSLEVNIVGKRQ